MSTMRHGVRVGRCRTSILCATWIERTDALSNVPRTEAIRTGRARQINAGPGLSYRIPALRQQAAPLPPSSPDCCKPAIPATGRPILPKTVERGTFREDLFYRLNVFAILIAPLRERADEILRPSAVFLQEIAHAFGPPPAGLTTHARGPAPTRPAEQRERIAQRARSAPQSSTRAVSLTRKTWL